MADHPEHYILATGGKDVARLRLLQHVYGPGTEAVLQRVGLRTGLRVVEVGCGSGDIACWVAQQVGPGGDSGPPCFWPAQSKQAAMECDPPTMWR